MRFSPKDHCHVSVVLKFLEMSMNQVAKFINSSIRSAYFLSEAGENLSGLITEKLDQDILFIFEIKIDRTIGNPRFLSNLRNR